MKFIYFLASTALLFSVVGCNGGGNKSAANPNEGNPFFASEWTANYGLPPFNEIKDEHFMPAVKEGMKRHIAEVDAIINNSEAPTYANTIAPYVEAGQFLERVVMVFFNLTGSDLTDERSKLQSEIEPMLTSHSNTISLNDKLFARIKAVYENQSKENLTKEQKRLLKNTFDGFARSGANLSAEDKVTYKRLSERESVLTRSYGNNLLKANNSFSLVIDDKKQLEGLSESQLAAAASAAKAAGQEGKWLFNLSYPSYFPFMTSAKNRDLRQKMFEAYSSRGFGEGEISNLPIINELVNLRTEKAKLLGYQTHAHYILDKNMAGTPEKVYELIETLWKPSVKVAKEELKEMKKLLKKDGINGDFKPWDWWYYADKVRTAKYALDDEMTRPYFSADNVREGVFLLLNKLHGVNFEPMPNAPKYHEDMTAYKVTEADGSLVGVLTIDLHPRPVKRGGAWCSSFRSQIYKDGKRVSPIVPIVCNFTPPTANEPALLSLEESSTYFHEMGHAIQVLLSDVKVNGLAGTSRDFVELPSQILEAWANHPQFMKMYAKHYKTGEVIPDAILEKIKSSKKFNKGFEMTEFLAAAYLDMEYHTMKDKRDIDPTKFEAEAMKKLGLIEEIIPRYRSTYFSHIFSGGYSAGYYGYKWADVLVADAFAAFVESGDLFNPELSSKYREEILEPWGTVSEMEMYLAFRGKEADMKYLMESIF